MYLTDLLCLMHCSRVEFEGTALSSTPQHMSSGFYAECHSPPLFQSMLCLAFQLDSGRLHRIIGRRRSHPWSTSRRGKLSLTLSSRMRRLHLHVPLRWCTRR